MEQRGFTLIELLVTITIIGVLASVVMPLSYMSVKRQKEIELRRNLRMIRIAIDEYKRTCDEDRIIKSITDSCYPANLEVLVEGVDDAKSPLSSKKIRFLRRIPRDPMSPDETIEPRETWALRSYQSDADDPREGDDVFDVYSKNDGIAIDGTLYQKW